MQSGSGTSAVLRANDNEDVKLAEVEAVWRDAARPSAMRENASVEPKYPLVTSQQAHACFSGGRGSQVF